MSLGESLTRAGIRRVYGVAVPGIPSVEVDVALARLLAEADGRAGPSPGAVYDGANVELLPAPLRSLAIPGDPPSSAPDVVLAGAEVIRAERVEELRRYAERAVVGVVNTFTAKGLFRWDSPWHFGTACLQERDLALAGLADAASILAVGVGVDEVPSAVLRAAGLAPNDARIVALTPEELPAATAGLAETDRDPPARPRLYTELFAAVQPLYRLDSVPVSPARAAAELAELVPDDATITGEPGRAGFWLGRTVPTARLGSVRIPASGRPGTAVAAAVSVALDGGHGVAVVDAPLTGAAAALLELARMNGLRVTVFVWSEEPTLRSADEHRDQVRAALATPRPTVLEVGVDFTLVDRLVEVAGPVCAWT